MKNMCCFNSLELQLLAELVSVTAHTCMVLVNISYFEMSCDSFTPFALCEIVLPDVIGGHMHHQAGNGFLDFLLYVN